MECGIVNGQNERDRERTIGAGQSLNAEWNYEHKNMLKND